MINHSAAPWAPSVPPEVGGSGDKGESSILTRAPAGCCAGFSQGVPASCLLSLDWGLLEGKASWGYIFCPWNPACIWYNLRLTPRDFQIFMAEPFPPPKLSLQGTQSGAGEPGVGERLRGRWTRGTRAGECGRTQQGRHAPPGAGHRPCP